MEGYIIRINILTFKICFLNYNTFSPRDNNLIIEKLSRPETTS